MADYRVKINYLENHEPGHDKFYIAIDFSDVPEINSLGITAHGANGSIGSWSLVPPSTARAKLKEKLRRGYKKCSFAKSGSSSGLCEAIRDKINPHLEAEGFEGKVKFDTDAGGDAWVIFEDAAPSAPPQPTPRAKRADPSTWAGDW